MSKIEDDSKVSSEEIGAAIRRAEDAIKALRASLKTNGFDELSAKAAQVAGALLSEGEALIADNEVLAKAQHELRGAVRTSPLTALAIAFGAGVMIAWFARS